MRIRFRPRLATTLVLLAACASVAQPARADDGTFDGNWKLVVLPVGSDEFAIVKLTDNDGKTAATVVDAQKMLGANSVKPVELKDGADIDTYRAWRRHDVQGDARQGRPGRGPVPGNGELPWLAVPCATRGDQGLEGRHAQAKLFAQYL